MTERRPAMQIPDKFIEESFSEAFCASLDLDLDSESQSGSNDRIQSGSGSEKLLTSVIGDMLVLIQGFFPKNISDFFISRGKSSSLGINY